MCVSIRARVVRSILTSGGSNPPQQEVDVAQYLLSVHSVEGEPPPSMTEEDMQLFMKRISAVEVRPFHGIHGA
jgi:hypothetical protein